MTESNGISGVVALAFAGPATFCAPTVMVASSNAARRAPVERRMIPPSVARGTMKSRCAQPNDLLDRLQIFFRSLSRHRTFGSDRALYSGPFHSPASSGSNLCRFSMEEVSMIRRTPGILILILSYSALAAAQGGGGRVELNGVITDQAKLVLPGVTVTVTHEGTGQTRQAVTTGEGRFIIPTLLPGSYSLKAELQGFETLTRTGLVLNVGQEVTVALSMSLAGVREEVTVTAESPVIETTASNIGTNITSNEIDNTPSAGRSQFSLMQTIPGLVPTLQVGSFEGGQFSANGQATTNNLFLVDGQYNNDSRLGGSQGTQARVTLDSMAEYQVQTHQYGAEYGGSTGVVVNSVTKSGSNKVAGRLFEYYQSNKLQATDYFLKKAGEENPSSGSNVFGGSVGGPIIKNKFFFFGNMEYDRAHEAANLSFPAIAAPLAVSYSTTTDFAGPNNFGRLDYQINGNNAVSFRWTRERVLTVNDSIEDDLAILDAARHENDSGDQVFSWSWTSVLNNRTTNEFKVGHVRENLLQGPKALFSDTDSTSAFFDHGWKFIGFHGLEPLDVGPQNSHPDFIADNGNTYA